MHWIRRHRRGRPPHPDVLTPAEWRVVDLARAGHTNPEIAEQLGITVPTVKTHMSRILDKLALPDRRALAAWDGQPAVPAVEAPRRAVLAAPLGWLTSRTAGGVAVAAGLAVLMGGLVIAMDFGRPSGGDVSTPAPTASETETPDPEATPGPSSPSFAPTGRTSDPALDALIDGLVTGDAETLIRLAAGAGARGRLPDANEDQMYTASEWAERLASADRSLYAVATGDPQAGPPREFEVVLAVSEAGAAPVGWRFALQDHRFVDITVGSRPPTSYAPGVARQYDRFLVLPPQDILPVPPPGRSLDNRSGHPGVDSLFSMLEARDVTALASSVEYERRACEPGSQPACPSGVERGEVDALPLRACGGNDSWISTQNTATRLERIASIASNVHAAVEIPEGYRPDAEHLLILVTQVAPYRWESAGIFEQDGQIVGLFTQCGEYPQEMYPPSAFLLPPPSESPLDAGRASGVAQVDAAFAALRAGDIATLDGLIAWEQIGCVTQQDGIGAPPLCEADEPPGTVLDVLSVVSCEGGPSRRANALEMFGRLASPDLALHSVADIGIPVVDWGFPPGALEVVLMPTNAENGAFALSFTEDGIAAVRFPCGPGGAERVMSPGRAPSFLLAPPP